MPDGWVRRAAEGFISIEAGCKVQSFEVFKVSDGNVVTNSTAEDLQNNREWYFYLLGAVCGIATGYADVVVDDLLFTALLVLSSCILLGMLRPRWPWRWVLTVGIFIPLTELTAYLARTVKPTRAQVYGSFLAFLPGIAGAYGGAVMRRVMDNLRQGK
jgi:hypothetical protein